ncbi:hypothetical protein [Lysobacter sp. Root494]|uniref:hypothetical protein n=1 Tax=Lysobacter sp. Root494 TaxID=1736549 RepID=UPI0007012537|nr:hypothetical protein [Lysobacter sp. Root494]KQY51852.1 hypothetical protein ASD14_04015 [Lysobacter sp. Root494]
MNEAHGYFVFFHPQALEALGAPIQPYLLGEGDNRHILCREVDTAGALIEMTLAGQTQDGRTVQVELMVPGSMVRMIVSAHDDEEFGFRPRVATTATQTLPPVGPTAAPAQAAPQSVPASSDTPEEAPTQTPTRP